MAGGFWNYALEDPAAIVVVDPDGTEYSAAEVSERSHRMVHGLRSLGLEVGDTVAAVLPNGINPVTVYLGALESGLYYVPINYRLSAPEVAYILSDSDAKAFISHERLADLAVAAADEAGIPAAARFAVGTVPGFADFDDFLAGQPADVPDDRTRRRRHALHLGHHRSPQGREAEAHRAGRRPRRRSCSPTFLGLFGIPPAGRQRAPVHVAELPHRGHHVRGQRPATRGTPSSSWTSGTPSRRWRKIERYRLHPHPHGPDAVPPDAAAARRREARVRRLVDALGHPRRRAVPDRREAPDARLVGSGDLRVLRRDRGRRHDRYARGLAEVPRHRRQRVADLGAQDRRRRRQGVRAGRARHRVDEAWAPATSSTRATRARPTTTTTPTASSPSATSGTSTRTGSCSSATARAT